MGSEMCIRDRFKAVANNELRTKQLEQKVDGIKNVVALNSTQWRDRSSRIINRIARACEESPTPDTYRMIRDDIYKEVEQRGGFRLGIRLTNMRRRMADNGVCKSKRDRLTKMDVIAEDRRLIEIFVAVVKEFAIKYGIEISAGDLNA
mgnify:CR=1 FL=1